MCFLCDARVGSTDESQHCKLTTYEVSGAVPTEIEGYYILKSVELPTYRKSEVVPTY